VQTPHLPKPARVFLPENWTATQAWPAIFFYPWTSGQADVAMMRAHTGGRDFIIVGMPPRDDAVFNYTPEAVTIEQTALREMRDTLAAEVRLDAGRVFVAGFSKGGWLSALLLAHEPGLAGGCVMGGGWVHRQHAVPRKFRSPVYVYVGTGRLDGNFPPSLLASREFARLGARVAFDAWPDTGHALPAGGIATGLCQWLALIARGTAVRDEAGRWAEEEWKRVAALNDPLAQRDELRRFGSRPFVRALGPEWSRRVEARLAELLRLPAVAAEAALERELFAIHEREIQDASVKTLGVVGPRYEELARRAPNSPTGKLARHHADLIKSLWATVPDGKR
jgi:dienelactone hydrolase